ncbi:Furin [Paramuricea clavata]|uniref:Furin, partial n=1 Tax=Paramuricea clavata TaxID=317549 RepID=A0A7D9I4H1_PARCT|nr:Furin [Paramuricea clavata]
MAGIWKSPGGGAKRFIAGQDSEFVLKWQKLKKLVIEKDNTDEYLSKYLKANACVTSVVAMNGCENEFLSTSSNGEGVHAANFTLPTETNINDDPSLVHLTKAVEAGFSLADTKIRNIEEKLNVKISDVLDDLNELKARSEPVSERLVNALLEENTKLKKDNDVLSGRLNNSLLVVSDLNTRIKDIENEKCSLITAIRLIQCADKSHVDSTVTEQLKSDDTNVFNQHDLSHNLSMNDVEESIRVVDKNPDYFLSSNKIPESQSLKRKYKSKSKRKGLNLDKNLSENANSTTRSEVLQQIPANNNSTAEPVMQQIPSNDNTMTEPVMQQIPSNVNSITDPVVQQIPSNTSGTNNLHTVPETHNKHANYSRVAEGIANLATQIEEDSPATSIVISSILPRSDKSELSAKATEANKLIKAICSKNQWAFIDHKSVNLSCLNTRGLHLNRKGTSIVAKNISKYINSC